MKSETFLYLNHTTNTIWTEKAHQDHSHLLNPSIFESKTELKSSFKPCNSEHGMVNL